MSRLYEREIKDFFEVAKIKMAGTTKEAKGKFGKSCDRLVGAPAPNVTRHRYCYRYHVCSGFFFLNQCYVLFSRDAPVPTVLADIRFFFFFLVPC